MDMLAAYSPIIPQPEKIKNEEKTKRNVEKVFFITALLQKTTLFSYTFSGKIINTTLFLPDSVATKIRCRYIISIGSSDLKNSI